MKIFFIYTAIIFFLCKSTNSLANIETPFQIIKQFDVNHLNITHDVLSGKNAIVVMGNFINLKDTEISLGNAQNRTKDLVLIAKEINLGPNTKIDAKGIDNNLTFEDSLRGGDIYIITSLLSLSGEIISFCDESLIKDNNEKNVPCQTVLKRPWKIEREGGENLNSSLFKGRRGKVHIFADSIVLNETYIKQQSVVLVQNKNDELTLIPDSYLKVFALGFSSGNSIHQFIASGKSLLWAELPKAFRVWLSQENAQSLLKRELRLEFAEDGTQQSSFDSFASLKDASKFVPIELLNEWYLSIIKIAAGSAQVAMAQSDFETANNIINKYLPLINSAPLEVLGNEDMTKAISLIRKIDEELTNKTIIEELTFNIDGAQPAKVVIMRNLSSKLIYVLPNQIVINDLEMNLNRRIGFLQKLDSNTVNMSIYGVLMVDPSIFELVKKKFENSQSIVRPSGSEIQFRSFDIGILDVITQSASISKNGQISLNLQFSADSIMKQIALMGQLFGIDTSLMYRTDDNNFGSDRMLTVNLNLRRTSNGIKITDNNTINPFKEAIKINYLSDNDNVISSEFPKYVKSGDSINYQCKTAKCFIPGSAILHDINWNDALALFEPLTDGSIIRSFEVTNNLDLNDSPRGKFSKIELTFEFEPFVNGSRQKIGPLYLTERGLIGSSIKLNFLGDPRGRGKLFVEGRVFWEEEQSFSDLSKIIIDPPTTFVIDKSFYKFAQ